MYLSPGRDKLRTARPCCKKACKWILGYPQVPTTGSQGCGSPGPSAGPRPAAASPAFPVSHKLSHTDSHLLTPAPHAPGSRGEPDLHLCHASLHRRGRPCDRPPAGGMIHG